MPRIIDSKVEEKPVAVGNAKTLLKVYSTALEFDPNSYRDVKDVLREADKLCYLGVNREKGIYPSKEKMIKCGECATNIRLLHAKAVKKGEPLIVEVRSNKPTIILPNLEVDESKNIRDLAKLAENLDTRVY